MGQNTPPDERPRPSKRRGRRARPETLVEAMDLFVREKLDGKAGQTIESYRINAILAAPLGQCLLVALTKHAIDDYCRKRLEHVAPSTVHNELRLIRMSIETARREWGLKLTINPAMGIELPASKPRRRVLAEGELEALYGALDRRPLLRAFVELTIETGMSRGELLKLQWEDVDLEGAAVTIKGVEIDEGRVVALNAAALKVLRGLYDGKYRVFHLSVARVRWGWEVACRRARIEDLRLNDLRRLCAG